MISPWVPGARPVPGQARVLQGSSGDHGVCKGPLAAQQAGLHRTRVYNRTRSIFWFGSQINHCLQCTRRNQTSPHCCCRQSPRRPGMLFGLWAGSVGEGGPVLALGSWGPQLCPRAPASLCYNTELTLLASHSTRLAKHHHSPQPTRASQRDREPQSGSARKKRARRQGDLLHDTAQSLVLSGPQFPQSIVLAQRL